MGISSNKNINISKTYSQNLQSKASINNVLKKRKKFNEIEGISILKSIKSFYNLIEIFSFLNTKQKLNIIIYSWHFQNELRIDIEDYKKLSGKYITKDKNGKVREYALKTNK